jgi:hypothetical protein
MFAHGSNELKQVDATPQVMTGGPPKGWGYEAKLVPRLQIPDSPYSVLLCSASPQACPNPPPKSLPSRPRVRLFP